MPNIEVHRYAERPAGWAGWLEPADRSWIMFIHEDGSVWACMNRDPVTGASR